MLSLSVYQTFLFHNSCNYCIHNHHQRIKVNKNFRRYQKVHNRSKTRWNRYMTNSIHSIWDLFITDYIWPLSFFYLHLLFLRNACVSFISFFHNLFPGCELTASIIFYNWCNCLIFYIFPFFTFSWWPDFNYFPCWGMLIYLVTPVTMSWIFFVEGGRGSSPDFYTCWSERRILM